jgi:hypothetical protein
MTGPAAEEGQRRFNQHPVIALESERCRAFEHSDFDVLQRIFSETLTYVHATGAVHNRDQLLEYMRRDIRLSVVKRSDLTVEHWGSVAICTGLMRLQGHRVADNSPFSSISFVTQAWTNHGTGWRLTLMQSTKVPDAMWPAANMNLTGTIDG